MVKKDIDIKKAFYMEPEDAVKYFQSKGLKTSFNWHEVYEEAHAKAFTIAKMTDVDLLKDTQEMLGKALKEGWSRNHFEREAKALFAKKGWTGHKEMTDPKTGETKVVELGTPRRIKKIFDCNMRSANMAAKYKNLLEDVDFAPYWQYICVLDGKTRLEHKALHGKVFRYDDEVWQSHFPPNGWNCRCSVRNLTEAQMNRAGAKCETSNLRQTKTVVGGEEKELTVLDFNSNGKRYTLAPDAGWASNPATIGWNLDVQAYKKITQLPQSLQDKFISDMAQNIYNRTVIQELIYKTIQNNLKSYGIEKPLTWFSPKIIKALKNENIALQSPVVVFEDRQVKHSLGDRKVLKQRLTKKQFLNLYSYITGADEIFIDLVENQVVYVKFLPKNEIIDGKDCIKIPIKINSRNPRRPVNYIGTTGRITYKDTFLKNSRYKKIE